MSKIVTPPDLTDEISGLSERLSALDKFIESPAFRKLKKPERLLLERQRLYMSQYLDVLTERQGLHAADASLTDKLLSATTL